MKSLFTAAAAIAMIAAVPTTAAVVQAATEVSPGMEVVFATDMSPVGTVTALQDGVVVIQTDKHEVALPADSVTPHEGKVLFGMSQADLNAAVEADLAKAEAMKQPGAPVLGSAGTQVGTIDAIDDEFVTIALENGAKVQIPMSGTAPSPNGLVIGLTAEQLAAQVPADAIPADGEATAEAGATAEGGTL